MIKVSTYSNRWTISRIQGNILTLKENGNPNDSRNTRKIRRKKRKRGIYSTNKKTMTTMKRKINLKIEVALEVYLKCRLHKSLKMSHSPSVMPNLMMNKEVIHGLLRALRRTVHG